MVLVGEGEVLAYDGGAGAFKDPIILYLVQSSITSRHPLRQKHSRNNGWKVRAQGSRQPRPS